MDTSSIAQANMDAAHDLEERFHRSWPQLWDDAGLFVNSRSGFAWRFYLALTRERPFLCVRCGRGISYASLIYSDIPIDKVALAKATCYPCEQMMRVRQTFFTSRPKEVAA